MPTNNADFDLNTHKLLNTDIRQYAGTTLTHSNSPVGTPLTVVAGTSVNVDTSTGTVEARLPVPAQGVFVQFIDSAATWDDPTPKSFKMTPNGGENLNGVNASIICNWHAGAGGAFCFDGANWITFGNLFTPVIRTVTDADAAILLSDCGPAGFAGTVIMNSASTHNWVLPKNGTIYIPIGYAAYGYQKGTGKVTMTVDTTGGAVDTIDGSGGKVASAGQFAFFGAWKDAATHWVAIGDRS